VYSKFQLAKKYSHYLLSASNGKGHGMHSPFVFEFITKVLNDKKIYPEYDEIEKLRTALLLDKTLLTIEDFGAGSRTNLQQQRTVSAIAKSSLKPKKFSQLLFRIIKFYQPDNILELGTSLGITSSYLAAGNKNAKTITLEGSSAVASVAKQNFEKLKLKNIELIEGNFDATLSQVIKQLSIVNFSFIDGNHRKEPTINYFHQLLKHSAESTILIFDDIHWSEEMEQAWNEIKQHSSVTLSIDLFFIGLIFLRKENKLKQDFVIRF
jgi:predicted O-methyltransferase YrrM